MIFGAGRMGTTIGSVLLDRGMRVRFVEARAEQARHVAETLPEARVFNADACDREFLERERIGKAAAAVFAMNDDPKNLFAAVLAKAYGVRLTIALAHDAGSLKVFEHGGINVGIDPRQVTAEEMVRFAHDPRIRQLAMLEDDRFEILDLTVREQVRADRQVVPRPAGDRLDDRRDHPRRQRDLPAQLRAAAGRRPRHRLRRIAPRVAGGERPLTGIDLGSALDLVGGVLKWVGLTFIVPVAVAVGYAEPFWPFLAAGAATAATGLLLDQITGEKRGAAIGARESFLVVALIWLLVPAFGALPFVLGDVPQLSRPVDAYFEALSGFTATGATLVPRIEELPRSMLFWRQLSHWLGGMGIIVLAVAVLPRLRVGGRQLLQSELAGPTEIERFAETVRETARRLWRLYAGLTASRCWRCC